MKCSRCGSEMNEETIRIRNESTLLPQIMLTRQYTCVNKGCERFSHPVTIRPLPAPRFTRGKDHLSEKERERLEQLRKVAMAPGLESTSLKVIDSITTYLSAGFPALMAINVGAASQVVRKYATNALTQMGEESLGQIVMLGPGDIAVWDQRTHHVLFKTAKSKWTPEDESKYVPPKYFVERGKDFTPEWLTERLLGDDLQAELLRLFRDHYRISPGRSLKDTSEGIAIRIGKDQAEVQHELDRLVERGILQKTYKKEYFDLVFPTHLAQRWKDKSQAKPKTVPTKETARLLQQLAPDSQRDIELACLRLLQQVAIESEFEITSLKVIEAIETLEAAAIPVLIIIGNRAANHAVRAYAHDTIVRIMESGKERRQGHLEKVISLNCPNCGGIAPSGAPRCEYCGVELVLGKRGFLPRSITPCPKCGNSMAGNAWFCVNCRQVLTSDVTQLKVLQKRLLLEHENNLQLISQKMPEIAERIEPEEFIYSMHYHKFGRSRSFEVVTDRKLMHYAHKSGRLREIPWSEFVRLGIPKGISLSFDILHRVYLYILPVQTLKEDFGIRFQVVTHGFVVRGDWEGCLNIYRTIKAAQNDYNTQRKNIEATICSLKGLNERPSGNLKLES